MHPPKSRSKFTNSKKKFASKLKLIRDKRWGNLKSREIPVDPSLRPGPSNFSKRPGPSHLFLEQPEADVSITPAIPSNLINNSESVAFKKLKLFENISQPLVSNDNDSYIFVKLSCLNPLVEHVVCPICETKNSQVFIDNEKKNYGLVVNLVTICLTCNNKISESLSSPRLGQGDSKSPFEISKLTVAATVDMGVGYAGLEKLCMMLNMPKMHPKTYNTHAKDISNASQVVAAETTKKGATLIRKTYEDLYPNLEDQEIIDIAISYDGSWQKRGHTSHFGVGCVIEIITGLVIDYEVMSTYCHGCETTGSYLDPQSEDYQIWKENHICDINWNGTAGGMEAAAAEILFTRSIAKNKFRYTTILSDGDAKTFHHLSDLQIYGDCHIVKEECLNHVAKRLGTALRKISKEKKLGGKGEGRLTEVKIKVLENYYYSAIANNREKGVDAMRAAVFATLFHCMSTDKDPHHLRCPDGVDSWCFYKKALANNETPSDHKKNVKHKLSYDVAQELIPIYQRLGSDELLNRCLLGKTQNANESLHSVIWRHCPKSRFLGKCRVDAGVALAISKFNQGISLTTAALMNELTMAIGANTISLAKKETH